MAPIFAQKNVTYHQEKNLIPYQESDRNYKPNMLFPLNLNSFPDGRKHNFLDIRNVWNVQHSGSGMSRKYELNVTFP